MKKVNKNFKVAINLCAYLNFEIAAINGVAAQKITEDIAIKRIKDSFKSFDPVFKVDIQQFGYVEYD
jgi:hypothetical protein|tara:strand:+ start:962 stop:1162 length:201 start_codon:yes stop_codon:yes gene_type:complete